MLPTVFRVCCHHPHLLACTARVQDKVKSFLTLHWADFDALPERKLLGGSSEPSEHATAVASMCEAETAAIAAKLRAKLDKVRLLFSRFPALSFTPLWIDVMCNVRLCRALQSWRR